MDAIDAATRCSVTGMPYPEDTFFLAGFGHLMGGYDAGYYGYLWAEVIGDDMFGRFAAGGHPVAEIGRDYRRAILEPNGARPADDDAPRLPWPRAVERGVSCACAAWRRVPRPRTALPDPARR